VGFTSAAAIIIATTQIKDILGLNFPGGKFLQVRGLILYCNILPHIYFGEKKTMIVCIGICLRQNACLCRN
jgi:MFS superfamily sulfate permease-like transporter